MNEIRLLLILTEISYDGKLCGGYILFHAWCVTDWQYEPLVSNFKANKHKPFVTNHKFTRGKYLLIKLIHFITILLFYNFNGF